MSRNRLNDLIFGLLLSWNKEYYINLTTVKIFSLAKMTFCLQCNLQTFWQNSIVKHPSASG